MRTAAEIVDAEAAIRGLCVPPAIHFPLGRDFAEACVEIAVREARAEWEKSTPRERQKDE